MSAKDDFLKKLKDTSNSGEAHAERVRQDIAIFRTRLSELAAQITLWLRDSGVEVVETENLLGDESVRIYPGSKDDCLYKTRGLKLKNSEKTAVLEAQWLYGAGVTGCATLIITNPYRAPSKTKFDLYMYTDGQPEEGWMIKRDHMPVNYAKLLTEEIFFGAIEALA